MEDSSGRFKGTVRWVIRSYRAEITEKSGDSTVSLDAGASSPSGTKD